jgi:hypothetical protein
VQEQWDGLSEQLREVDTVADNTGQQAADAVDALATSAHDIAEARLTAGGEDVAQTETTLAEGLGQGRDDLQEGFSSLAAEGFEATASLLDAVLGALDEDRSESDQAFDDADQGVQEKEPELDKARAEAEQDFTEAETSADADGGAVEQASQEGQSAWSESIAGELESGCQAVSDPLESLYEAFGDSARSDGEALMTAASARGESAAQMVGIEMTTSLEGAFTEDVDGALAEWGTALDGALVVLREGEQAGRELDPLVEQVATARDVVSQIERLVDAMGGGA